MSSLPVDASEIPVSTLTQLVVFVLLVIGAVAVVRFIGRVRPRRARKLERVRTKVWQALHPLDGSIGNKIPPADEPRDLIRDKTDSDEYVCTVSASQKVLEEVLYKRGWRWNPVSTKKYRMVDGEKQFTRGTWVYRSELFADKQLHCYFFPAGDNEFDIYAHKEDNLVSNPREHTDASNMVDGDPNGLLRADIEEAGIEYEE